METAESDFPRKAAHWFFVLLFLGGIVFYLSWGILYNTWDLSQRSSAGVYAITVLMLGFGGTGLLLYGKRRQ